MNEIYTVAELAIATDEDQLLVSVVERIKAGDVIHSDSKIDCSARILNDIGDDFKRQLVNYILDSVDPSLSKAKANIERNIAGSASALISDYDRGF